MNYEKERNFVRSHHRLIVWQKAVELAKTIYQLTSNFPKEETYGLVNQMRRSSVSVASNIAEGAGRISSAEKIKFFVIARGSLMELDTQIEIAAQLGYCLKQPVEDCRALLNSVSRLLNGLIASRKMPLPLAPRSSPLANL